MISYLVTFLEFALIIFLAWACRRDGFKRGYDQALKDQEKIGKDCYRRGRADESNYWLGVDHDVTNELWQREPGR